MEEQRARAKADAKAARPAHADVGVYRALLERPARTEFTGYADLRQRRRVVGLLVDGRRRRPPARATTSRSCSTARRSTPRAAASRPTPGG